MSVNGGLRLRASTDGMIGIRGSASVIPSGVKAFAERFEDTIVRIHPTRIIAFSIDADRPGTNA